MAEGQWGVIELMGHQVMAGLICKDESLGFALMRVDVPATKYHSAFTRFLGDKAVFSITVVSEAVAMATAEQCAVNPVAVYVPELVTRQQHDDVVDKLKHEIMRLSRGLPEPDGEEENGER